jgi:hypothetical protein
VAGTRTWYGETMIKVGPKHNFIPNQKEIGFVRDKLTWLVVWNMNFIFPYIGNFIIPTDFHIFQRGWLNHQPVTYGIVT